MLQSVLCITATAVSHMINKGVPEKLISGHKSIEVLRCYGHSSIKQEQAAGAVISDPTSTNEDMKPDVSKLATALPGFSGNLTNCTINFNLK